MRHALIAATLLLAFSAGVTLAETGAIAFAPLPTATPPAAARTTVERFYEAINTTLATGDSTALALLIAPDFRDATPPPGISPDRAGFLAYLHAVHRTLPTLRLTPTDILVGPTSVAALIQVAGADGTATAAGPTGAHWPPIDLLQVAAGQVTGRHSGNAGQSWLAPLLTTTLALSGPGRQIVSLDRETYRQKTAAWQTASGPILMVAESGSLTVTLDQAQATPATLMRAAAAPTALPSPAQATLTPGDALALPAKSLYHAGSATGAPATALTLRIVPLIYAPGFDEQSRVASLATPAAGSPERVGLAGGMAVRLLLPAVTIAMEQVALTPGTALPAHQVQGAEMIIVTGGELALTVADGPALLQRQPGGAIALGEQQQTLPAGSGVLLDHGATVTLRPAGETALVLTRLVLRPVPDAAPA